VYGAEGKPEAGYRPDPSGQATLSDLATALGGRSFDERELGAAATYLRTVAGSGPTVRVAGTDSSRTPLAPYVAILGLLALLAAIGPMSIVPVRIRLSRQ
jgi:hypothetical protein